MVAVAISLVRCIVSSRNRGLSRVEKVRFCRVMVSELVAFVDGVQN